MMDVRYPLSLRNVEDLLDERGIDISHETVRFWWNRFGPMFAAEIRVAHMCRYPLPPGMLAYRRRQPTSRRHHGRRASAIAASRSASDAYSAIALSAVAGTVASSAVS